MASLHMNDIGKALIVTFQNGTKYLASNIAAVVNGIKIPHT